MRNLAQLPLEPYLYKYAIRTEYYDGDEFRIPFYFPMPIHSNWQTLKDYFNRMENHPDKKILLVNMFSPSKKRLFALQRYLQKSFLDTMYQLLIGARAYRKRDKDVILQYLDCLGIEENEYSYERAAKSWTRKKQKLKQSGQSIILDFNYNDLRPSPNKKRGRDLPPIDIQQL